MNTFQEPEQQASTATWHLFHEHTELRAVIDAVLKGRVGSIHHTPESSQAAAALRVGTYIILGGDAESVEANALIRAAVGPVELVYAGNAWRRRIVAIHGSRAVPDPMQSFDSSQLDKTALMRLANKIPKGFEVRHIKPTDLAALGPDLSPNGMDVYASPEAFIQHGAGCVAVTDDGQLACVASSYTATLEQIEVAIATAEPWRGRGLATVVAARLLHNCLERGVIPEWNAANPVSKRLALRLGYRASGTVNILRLRKPSLP